MNFRKRLIRVITFLGGSYFFAEWLLPQRMGEFEFGRYHDQISNGFIAVGMMAIGLGLVNLVSVHGAKIVFRRKGWGNSVALLAGLVLMTYVMATQWITANRLTTSSDRFGELALFAKTIDADTESNRLGVPPRDFRLLKLKESTLSEIAVTEKEIAELKQIDADPNHPDYARFQNSINELGDSLTELTGFVGNLDQSAKGSIPASMLIAYEGVRTLKREVFDLRFKYGFENQIYTFFYDGLFNSLGAAMFSLLGFYITAAAYRAFRVQSAESALMMIAALLVMLGQIPFGIWLWGGLPEVRDFLLTVPNTAAFRAIAIGASIAGLVMAWRMWFSIESEYVDEGKG